LLPRLYAILDVALAARRGIAPEVLCDTWLGAGVRLIQLRAKSMPPAEFLALAEVLTIRARSMGALLIVNDRADIARWSGASGVHLGQHDLSTEDARRLLPPPAIVGVSTHAQGELRAALDAPIDYVAMGPVFPTTTKEQPDPVVGLEGVRQAATLVRPRGLPLVAIGGITLERAPEVIAAGADAVAVISDLLNGDDLAARARAFIDAVQA
jgi:thiamine-phosphate pyrophosphorylase